MNKLKNLSLIQVLRGIASLMVVLFHVSVNCEEIFKKQFLFNVFGFGRAGVDVFFVLSGFIMTYTNAQFFFCREKLFPFFKRRFVRIYPVYWIIISIFLAVQFILPMFYRNGYDFTLLNFFSTFLLIPGHTMVNGVSWTLSYEVFFYLLFSLVFIIRKKQLLILIMTLYLLLIIEEYVSGNRFFGNNNWSSFTFSTRNIEFFIGIAAALAVPKISRFGSVWFFIPGLVLFIFAAIIYNMHLAIVSDTVLNRVILFGIPSFLIIAGMAIYEMERKIKVSQIFLSLGDASYSLYLLHLPLVAAGLRILAKFSPDAGILLINIFSIVLVIFIAYSSILFFKMIENPLITKLNKKKNQIPAVSPS